MEIIDDEREKMSPLGPSFFIYPLSALRFTYVRVWFQSRILLV
jgi:hypothetical protein